MSRPSSGPDHNARPSALSRAAVPHSELAHWLLAKEFGDDADAPGVRTAAERVCQKLSSRLSRLVSPAGSQAILSRALYLARADFPFLERVRAGIAPETCFGELAERINDVEDGEARKGLVSVLGILLDLLVAFIGEDLTLRLVREVWPDLPLSEPADHGIQTARRLPHDY